MLPFRPMILAPRYGRLLDDFTPGDVTVHPSEVTLDDGVLALFFASFPCAVATYTSRLRARALGFEDRPMHPLLLLNLGLSFSVEDVSERAVAHLAYIDVRFPEPCYAGDTVRAASRVLGVKPVSKGDKGVVHVRTHLVSDRGHVVCAFERKALLRAGKSSTLPARATLDTTIDPTKHLDADLPRSPAFLGSAAPARVVEGERHDGAPTAAVGDVIVHVNGRTVGESETMQLTNLLKNSHPLHFDEVYCRTNSFAKTRVVYGGLVLAWALALASRDTARAALWDVGLDDGAHPSGVLPGDTIYAATRVVAREPIDAATAKLTLRVVGVKNATSAAVLDRVGEAALFAPELGKPEAERVPEKVVEITRTLLVAR